MDKKTKITVIVLNFLTRKFKSKPINWDEYHKYLKIHNFIKESEDVGLFTYYNENIEVDVDWNKVYSNKELIHVSLVEEIERFLTTIPMPLKNLFDASDLLNIPYDKISDLFKSPLKILWYPSAGCIGHFPFERFTDFKLEGEDYVAPNLFFFTDVSGDHCINNPNQNIVCEFKIKLKSVITENNPNYYVQGYPINNYNDVTFMKVKRRIDEGKIQSYYVIYANVENNSFAKKILLEQGLQIDYIFNQNWGWGNQTCFKHLLPVLKKLGCKVVISSAQLQSTNPILEQINLEATTNLVGENYNLDEIILSDPQLINNFYYHKVVIE